MERESASAVECAVTETKEGEQNSARTRGSEITCQV